MSLVEKATKKKKTDFKDRDLPNWVDESEYKDDVLRMTRYRVFLPNGTVPSASCLKKSLDDTLYTIRKTLYHK